MSRGDCHPVIKILDAARTVISGLRKSEIQDFRMPSLSTTSQITVPVSIDRLELTLLPLPCTCCVTLSVTSDLSGSFSLSVTCPRE